MGLLWLGLGLALVFRPSQMRAASQRFGQLASWIPIPPLVGIPLWVVRLCGIIAACVAGLLFYLFVMR